MEYVSQKTTKRGQLTKLQEKAKEVPWLDEKRMYGSDTHFIFSGNTIEDVTATITLTQGGFGRKLSCKLKFPENVLDVARILIDDINGIERTSKNFALKRGSVTGALGEHNRIHQDDKVSIFEYDLNMKINLYIDRQSNITYMKLSTPNFPEFKHFINNISTSGTNRRSW